MGSPRNSFPPKDPCPVLCGVVFFFFCGVLPWVPWFFVVLWPTSLVCLACSRTPIDPCRAHRRELRESVNDSDLRPLFYIFAARACLQLLSLAFTAGSCFFLDSRSGVFSKGTFPQFVYATVHFPPHVLLPFLLPLSSLLARLPCTGSLITSPLPRSFCLFLRREGSPPRVLSFIDTSLS